MKTILLLIGMIFATQPTLAADSARLVGVWKLFSYQTEFQDGRPKRALFGEHPSGYLILTKEGRQMAIIEGEKRKPPSSDADRADLLRTLIAYSGKYHVEGSKFITAVDAAWNPAWDGTDQVRSYEIAGDRLTVTSMWQPSPNIPGSPITRGILVFDRVK
jgi:Lipocalin-like domain